MKIEIKFRSIFKKIKPICRIYTKNDSHTIEIDKQQTFIGQFDIAHKDTLNIEFTNKDGVDDNVVHIDELHIDEINLQHCIYEGEFFPEYDSKWLEQQTTAPPESYKPCTELRLKGIWKFSIITPIWKMIMEKWLNDKR